MGVTMDDDNREIALMLSSGGYPVPLFTLGSLWRLNELELLAKGIR